MKSFSIIAFFWRHIKPYKWYYAVMLTAPLVASFYPLCYNYAIKLLVDTMVEQPTFTFNDVLIPIILFLITQFVLDFSWRTSDIAEWKSEPYVRQSIVKESYDYVQHHDYTFFQNNFTGTVSSKIKGILDGYDKFWAEMHHGLSKEVMASVVNFCALALVSLRLSLFMLVWSCIYVGIIYQLSKRLNTLSMLETEARHGLMGQIADLITNIISLFSFATRRQELQRLDKRIVDDFTPKQIRMYKYNFVIQVTAAVLYFIMFASMLFYMIHLRMQGLVSIGDFTFVFGIALVLAEDIWSATRSLQDFARAMGDLRSSLTIVHAPQLNLDSPTAVALNIHKASIHFKNIGFRYNNDQTLFNNLNLNIAAGEKVGLVGYSGSGKSTLINLLLRYYSLSSGTITIGDQDISTATQDSIRETIAVIPQDTMLFHRTIMDNIRYGRWNASDEDVIAASRKAHLHEFIVDLPLQYNTEVGERGIKLSGGQRQRIAIARAILKQAPILVLDEATSALDSHTEKLIQEGLNLLIEDQQKTVIAVAHRLSTLKHMDRIIVLDKGTIVEQGSHDELIQKPASLYSKLWQLQVI